VGFVVRLGWGTEYQLENHPPPRVGWHGIPGAHERTQDGIEQARRGEGVSHGWPWLILISLRDADDDAVYVVAARTWRVRRQRER
jgi:hypothetical protein